MRAGLWWIGVALVAGLIALANGEARAADVLRVAVTPSAGFGAVGRNGQLDGFDVDVARTLCEEMAARCDIVMLPFAEVMDRLATGKNLDFAVASVLRTPERERRFLFTDRYWRSSSSFVARTGSIQGAVPDAVAGRRIATLTGSRQNAFARERLGGRADSVEFTTIDQTLDAVRRGDADVALVPTITALLILSSEEGRGMEVVGDPITENGLGGDVAIALPFGREALRDRVNQALRTILLNGRYDAISSRYFPFRVY
ncbi:MAG TPA: transporter substrate-binding domain-containing protein [Azospirillum sp.]|nr:transporter substrate-binding domain-containing protein [Azospirillum sp.]